MEVFFGRRAQQGRVAERKAMIERDHELPIKRQAELLGISRGTAYYRAEPVSPAQLALMCRIDELHLEHPFAGSRMLRDLLRLQGVQVGRRHVGTDVAHGHPGAVPQTQHDQAAPGACGVPGPASWPSHRAGQPGLGAGHQCAM